MTIFIFFLFKAYLFLFYVYEYLPTYCTMCVPVMAKREGQIPQELQLWIVLTYCVSVGNLPCVLYKCSWCCYMLSHQSEPVLPFKPGLSPAWQTPSKLGCLTTESQGTSITASSALGPQTCSITPGLLVMWILGVEVSLSFLQGKYFIYWAVSLAPGSSSYH